MSSYEIISKSIENSFLILDLKLNINLFTVNYLSYSRLNYSFKEKAEFIIDLNHLNLLKFKIIVKFTNFNLLDNLCL